MKLTKYPDGRWEFEDVSAEEAMKLTTTNGHAKKGVPPKKKPAREAVDVVELNESQLQTWQYLTAHDVPEGIRASQYANDAGLNSTTAAFRLGKLTELGLAYKLPGGYYRPGDVDE